ncbi:MAG: TrbI/VirB10 family protein [Alphaproteobacteria bacterium]|nr:TrbI/VirB10 family protein [Alphaproteobacteria bacterium]
MAEPNSPKVDPETLVLRASPRKVVRFKRDLLIGVAAIGALAIFGTTWFALRNTSLLHHQGSDELYNTDRKPAPEGLAALPSGYDKIKLGEPLPGDLGKPVVDRERSLGLSPADQSFHPNPEDDDARAERIHLAQQQRQAMEAGVFFQIADKSTLVGALGAAIAPSATTPEAAASSATSSLSLDPMKDPNDQVRKLDFLSGKVDDAIYNPHTLQQPASPYEVMAGSVISASLISGLNSDLPGLVIAQVTEPVYCSVWGTVVCIPQGSRLIGTYDSVVAFGQSRALVAWQRIITPNGSSIQIDNLPASDTSGYAGLEDDVDYHTWTLLKGIAMSTLLGVGSQITFGSSNSDLVQAIRESTQESTNQAGQQIVEKDLNIQPTITVRPGWPLRVIVHKDLVLKPYEG